jgi:iron-sulfur cluster repair protein YtfE (RIC family)
MRVGPGARPLADPRLAHRRLAWTGVTEPTESIESTGSTDLAELVARDHRVIDELFTALGTERQDRLMLAHRLLDELATHTAAEQQILYPALRDIVPGGVAMANRAQTDHQAMRRAMEVVEGAHPGEARFEEALTALAEEVRAHAPVEEAELLPALREAVGDQPLRDLGAIYVRMKESYPSGLQALAADIPEPRLLG